MTQSTDSMPEALIFGWALPWHLLVTVAECMSALSMFSKKRSLFVVDNDSEQWGDHALHCQPQSHLANTRCIETFHKKVKNGKISPMFACSDNLGDNTVVRCLTGVAVQRDSDQQEEQNRRLLLTDCWDGMDWWLGQSRVQFFDSGAMIVWSDDCVMSGQSRVQFTLHLLVLHLVLWLSQPQRPWHSRQNVKNTAMWWSCQSFVGFLPAFCCPPPAMTGHNRPLVGDSCRVHECLVNVQQEEKFVCCWQWLRAMGWSCFALSTSVSSCQHTLHWDIS